MARLRSFRRLLRRFGQIGNRRRVLAAEAVAWLLLARLALVFIPFGRLSRHLGTFLPPAEARAVQARGQPTQDQAHLAAEVGWAVTRSARYVPFKAVCLPQAMAARVMLKRRGVRSVLHLGAARGTEMPLDAHAWVDAAGVEVTGYPVAEGFAEIACFGQKSRPGARPAPYRQVGGAPVAGGHSRVEQRSRGEDRENLPEPRREKAAAD
jgi:hypothetical protein